MMRIFLNRSTNQMLVFVAVMLIAFSFARLPVSAGDVFLTNNSGAESAVFS